MNGIGAINWVTGILAIVFTVINLKIYHKLFHVYYFDLGKGLFKEIVFSFIISVFETGIVMTLFAGALSVIGKIILAILKIVLILAAVLVVIGIIGKIIQVISEKSGTESSPDNPMQKMKDFVDDKAKKFKEKAEEVRKTAGQKDGVQGTENTTASHNEMPMIVCKKCGRKFSDGNMKFCISCGEKLEKEPEPVDEPEESVETAKMNVCPQCGQELPENGNFCIFCGAKVDREEKSQEAGKTEESEENYVLP